MKAKSILFVIFLTTMSVSCSTDDDSENSKDDIIGTWGIFEYLEEDGRVREVDPRLSENQITFNSDGTVISERILEDFSNWENIGNETYRVNVDDESLLLEILQNEILKTEYGNGEATFFKKMKE